MCEIISHGATHSHPHFTVSLLRVWHVRHGSGCLLMALVKLASDVAVGGLWWDLVPEEGHLQCVNKRIWMHHLGECTTPSPSLQRRS